MNLRVRTAEFSVNTQDYGKIILSGLLARKFKAKGTKIEENLSNEDMYVFTLSRSQFSYLKLQNLQKSLRSLRFISLSDNSWLSETKPGFLKSREGNAFYHPNILIYLRD